MYSSQTTKERRRSEVLDTSPLLRERPQLGGSLRIYSVGGDSVEWCLHLRVAHRESDLVIFQEETTKTVELGGNGREDAGGGPLWDVLHVRHVDEFALGIKQVVLTPEFDVEVVGQVSFHDDSWMDREGPNLMLLPALVELQGEEDVGGLALAIC